MNSLGVLVVGCLNCLGDLKLYILRNILQERLQIWFGKLHRHKDGLLKVWVELAQHV